MEIVYISKSTIPSRAANSVHVIKMCHALADNGNKVVLLAPNTKDEYDEKIKDIYNHYGVKKNFEIKKLWYPNIKGRDFFYTLAIFIYLLFKRKSNLIYGRFILGCYVASLLRYKVIFESHAPIYKKKNINQKIFKKLIKSKFFVKLVVISKVLKNMYLDNGFLNNSKIEVNHDAADEVENFNNTIHLYGDDKTLKIGYVGHLYKGRGIDVIVECASQIKDATFHIVGGTKKDIEYWKNYIKPLKLNNIFFYGFVPPSETKKYNNSFDILLAPYSSQVTVGGHDKLDTSKFMSPIKIFEYMSHKKAIIASDLPVLREVLSEKNSVLVEPTNIKDWTTAIEKLKDLTQREKIANQAIVDFDKYTWKKRAEKVISFNQ